MEEKFFKLQDIGENLKKQKVLFVCEREGWKYYSKK